MKKFISASVLAIGLTALAQSASAGIVGSAHDLSPQSIAAGGTTQICVFCHTPHGSNTAVSAPLWNKNIATTTDSYVMYTSATMDGAAAGTNLTVSLACLSCHDGVQARDNMINAPGSGGYVAGGADQGWIGPMPDGIVNLATDLSNDHPVGMPYCAAADVDTLLLGSCGDDSFNTTTNMNTKGKVAGAVDTRVFIDSNDDGAYQKTDLPLYGTAGGVAGIIVECATCHDPHNTDNGTFLRVNNDASSVCLTCHNK